MDSTLQPHPQTSPLSFKHVPSSSATKLPIKRKTPIHTTTSTIPSSSSSSSTPTITTIDFDTKPPPFKFHRIWTEEDEIRFLEGLLNSSSLGLTFPRDFCIFFTHFSQSTPQTYSKSQLSEKLRRLRKKFRATSSRISRGLNPSLLSPHDRALFDLSTKLWSPEFASTSPFGTQHDKNNNNNNITTAANSDDGDDCDCDGNVVVRMSGSECEDIGGRNGVVKSVVRSVLNVFDECLKDFGKKRFVCPEITEDVGKVKDFETRWKEQRVTELDVFARRLRLVLENYVRGQ